jgi:hypothetical protein
MRVTDIRDPYHPVEIGYYNPGTTGIVGTATRPVVRAERGEIWFVNDQQGLFVVRFEDGIWPFEGSARCPEFDDYYYAQYNPDSPCATANLDGVGKPAPGRAAAARKPAPRLELSVTPARDRSAPYEFRIAGSLVPPDFITLDRGCRGTAKLSARGVRQTLRIDPACHFTAGVTTKRSARRFRLTVRFRGNAALAARTRHVVARAG